MTDRDALLRAIAANPDDDTPRLIYADLLDELGGAASAARARFIRLQIETHRDPNDTDDEYSEYSEYDARVFERQRAEALELANRHHAVWLRELPTWVNPPFGLLGVTRANLFPRGFVERVTIRAKSFALRAEELFETHPIRALELQGGSAKLISAVFARPELARLRALSVSGHGAPEPVVMAITDCPWLSGLAELDLSNCGIGGACVSLLSRADRLPALRTVRLGGPLDVATVRRLAASPKLGSLREIDIRACRPYLYARDLREEFPDKVFRAWDQ
jgi:uncharacterized protein (TIGR02996 family)